MFNSMARDTTWSLLSLVDISKDTISSQSGQVSVSDGTIQMGANSSIEYRYTYKTTDRALTTSILKIITPVRSDVKSIESRYNNLINITISLRYFSKNPDTGELVLSDWDESLVLPYFDHESDGYVSSVELETNTRYIGELVFKISTNDIEGNVYIKDPQILYAITFTEEVDQYFKAERIESINSYDNGIIVRYVGDDEPVTLKVTEITQNEEYMINVSGRYEFNFKFNTGEIPY